MVTQSESQERTIEHQRKVASHEAQSHENALERLVEERELKRRKHEEIHRQLIEDEREAKITEIESRFNE